ncbi:MAG: DNA cytosine methyltransferase [Candidatus Altiarchaeota archaeon]|nr:DNA cytosine methyltransferase [Candidatus Altiarchaeota archaeon]
MTRKKKETFKLIDAFSGAGGLTLGFTKVFNHKFKPVWANDFNAYAAATYNENFGKHCISEDINKVINKSSVKIPKADVVIGGPPCQGFSLLNKNREGDPRKQLWRQYMDLVEKSCATIFVMENVPQLLDSFEHGELLGVAEAKGFSVRWAKLNAADYGVPQTRYRAFIIGCNFTDPKSVFPPKKTHYKNDKILAENRDEYVKNPNLWITVRDAIGDLPEPEGTEIRSEASPLNLHFGRNPTEVSRNRFKAIPREGMNRFDLQRNAPELTPECWKRKKSGGTDLFGRMWWDKPAVTIRTEFFKPEKGRYIHPVQHRAITHREAARLQSFPDDFVFKGTKIEIAKQIGNAVPPLLASRIADCVESLLER